MLSGDAVELLAHVGPDCQEAEHIVHGVKDEGVLLWEVVQNVGEFFEGPSRDDVVEIVKKCIQSLMIVNDPLRLNMIVKDR